MLTLARFLKNQEKSNWSIKVWVNLFTETKLVSYEVAKECRKVSESSNRKKVGTS